MAKYRLTPDAKKDLVNIRSFTKDHWGNEQSKKYIAELQQTLRILSDNPLMGVHRTELGDRVYSFPCASHIVYYIIYSKKLIVFALLHGSMVPENHLTGRKI